MKALERFLRNRPRHDFLPYLIMKEDESKDGGTAKIPVRENVITGMCLRGTFNPSRIRVIMSKLLATTMISLCMSEDSYPYLADSFIPISGVLRELVTEDGKSHGRLSHY